MKNQLLSKFETYLLDEALELRNEESEQKEVELDLEDYEEFPKGFFSSL
ncbi:hypothetical protein QUF56_01485 [Ureibacillus composti]|nr:hypothetical protein [Ureibacillus composti]